MPVTLPDGSTIAVEAELDDHVPPLIVLESATVAPIHTLSGPVISGGVGPTDTVLTVKQPEPLNENVMVAEP